MMACTQRGTGVSSGGGVGGFWTAAQYVGRFSKFERASSVQHPVHGHAEAELIATRIIDALEQMLGCNEARCPEDCSFFGEPIGCGLDDDP